MLRIAIYQYDITWMDPAANVAKVRSAIKQKQTEIGGPFADVMVLPEMFSTGFTIESQQLSETMDGPTLSAIREIAKESGMAIVGSMPVKEEEQTFNRMFFICPDGTEHFYDKRHLFSLGTEAEAFAAGTKRTIVTYKGFRFMMSVCYDLRFPVWLRTVELDYDVMLNVANWPKSRIMSYEVLTQARAIENQAYVVAVNRVGTDGLGFEQGGSSSIYSPKGSILQRLGEEEAIAVSEITHDEIDKFRRKFCVWRDADKFALK